MSSLLLTIIALFMSVSAPAKNADADKIVGLWISPDKDLIVKCYKEQNKYHAKIVWYKKYQDKVKSAERATSNGLPQEKWMNAFVVKDFVYADTEWNNGKIYDIKSGKKYTGYIKLNNDDELFVTGYVCFRFLCQTMHFTRYAGTKLPIFV